MLVILYECDRRSFTLREEQKLRMFENRVKKKTVGRKREEVTRVRRQLRNEKLHGFCSWPNILRVMKWMGMRWVGDAAQIGKNTNADRIVVENLKVRDDLKDLGIDGRIILKDTEMSECTDWIDLVQDRDKWLFTNHLTNSIFHSWLCHLVNNK